MPSWRSKPKSETGTFSREERVQGVLVSKSWGERFKNKSGLLIEVSHVEAGATTLTTIRTGYSREPSVPAAERGLVKSIQHPDGTVELHSHTLQGGKLVTMVGAGAGNLSAVTAVP